MPARSISAVVPALPFHSSSTGTSFYIQQRTALFARVAVMCSAAGMTVQSISDLARGSFRAHAYLYFMVANLTLLALWWFVRGKPRPLPVVRRAELAAVAISTTAGGFALRLALPGIVRSISEYCRVHGGFVGLDPGLVRLLMELAGMMIALLASTQILGLRAALVPSSFRHSLAMVAVVGLPLIVASGAGVPAMLPSGFPLVPREHAFLINFGIIWWLFTSVVCAVIAHIVHRLQVEVACARRLGQYELGEKLGEGGMGVVYRAHHALMKRPVAIKLLPPEQAGQESIARFEREVQLASQLSHPNTVVIHDYGRTPDGIFYYAMELIEGPTLERIIGLDGRMPSCRVVHVLHQVAAALAEAHEHGLVHRDIKPANILLGPRGGEADVVKVLDFGLVRSVRAQAELTNAGSLMGTPLYMSPEAIKSPDRVDGRSDLYSLGAVAYYLLTSRHVFEAESAIEVCTKHLHEPPIPLDNLAADLDPNLGRLVLDCLAKNPAQRPGSARELLERLEGCPTYGEWTRERAQAWWDNRRALLCRASKPMAAPPMALAQTVAHLDRVP